MRGRINTRGGRSRRGSKYIKSLLLSTRTQNFDRGGSGRGGKNNNFRRNNNNDTANHSFGQRKVLKI